MRYRKRATLVGILSGRSTQVALMLCTISWRTDKGCRYRDRGGSGSDSLLVLPLIGMMLSLGYAMSQGYQHGGLYQSAQWAQNPA